MTGYQKLPTRPTISSLRRESGKFACHSLPLVCDRSLAARKCLIGVLIRLQIPTWVSLPLLFHPVAPRTDHLGRRPGGPVFCMARIRLTYTSFINGKLEPTSRCLIVLIPRRICGGEPQSKDWRPCPVPHPTATSFSLYLSSVIAGNVQLAGKAHTCVVSAADRRQQTP